MDDLAGATSRARRKAAISFAFAVAAAVFSALDLHLWHIDLGLALTAIAAFCGLTRWKPKYSQPGGFIDSRVTRC